MDGECVDFEGVLGPGLLAEVDRVRGGLSRRCWLRALAESAVLAHDAFVDARVNPARGLAVADPSRVSSTFGQALRPR